MSHDLLVHWTNCLLRDDQVRSSYDKRVSQRIVARRRTHSSHGGVQSMHVGDRDVVPVCATMHHTL